MNVDLKDSLTYTAIQPSILASGTNAGNVNSSVFDSKDYIGQLAVVVSIGAQSVTGAAATVTLGVLSSATNNIANAVAVAAATNTVVATANNASTGVVVVDKRADNRYVFVQATTSGVTNSPSVPFSAVVVGQKQVQP